MRRIAKLVPLHLLRAYKWAISPLFPPACRYIPTCSEYAEEAIDRYGVLRGGAMTILRLLRHADFERVYKQGRRNFSTSMTVFYLPRQEASHEAPKTGAKSPSGLRIGFTVGRALGGAVQRNRMKRRLREAVRLCRPEAALDVDVVINPKKSLLTTDFSAVLNEVTRAFAVIEQKLSRKQQSPEN